MHSKQGGAATGPKKRKKGGPGIAGTAQLGTINGHMYQPTYIQEDLSRRVRR